MNENFHFLEPLISVREGSAKNLLSDINFIPPEPGTPAAEALAGISMYILLNVL